MRSVGMPRSARTAARLTAVVVLPLPPFRLTTAMVRTVMSPRDGGGATDRQHALLARRAVELELTDQQSSPPGTQGTSGLNRYGRASLTIGRMSGAVSPHPHGPL